MPERAARVVHSPPADHGAPGHDPVHPAAADEEAPAADGLLLSRRVPQAHLAPELRGDLSDPH